MKSVKLETNKTKNGKTTCTKSEDNLRVVRKGKLENCNNDENSLVVFIIYSIL